MRWGPRGRSWRRLRAGAGDWETILLQLGGELVRALAGAGGCGKDAAGRYIGNRVG